MTAFLQQLRSLLWRNVLLKTRHLGLLFQELIFPICFVLLLVMTKSVVKPDTRPSYTFPPHDVNSTDFGTPFTSNEIIYVAPNTSQYSQWMEDIVSQLDGPPRYTMFASEADAEAAYTQNFQDVKFGVIFNYNGDPYTYAIRTSFHDVPSSKDIFDIRGEGCHQDDSSVSSDCRVNKYLTSGFVQLQMAIENRLMTNFGVSSQVLSSRQIQVQMMNVDEYTPDTVIQTTSTLYFIFSFCILASYLAINIVAEKEKKIKDGMLMMGLNPNVFWLSWSIIYVGMVIIASLIMIGIIVAFSYFKGSNMFLLFLMFILYGGSFIALGFMITPFFNKARVAGGVVGLSTVFISLLYLIVIETRDPGSYDSNIPVWSQFLMCLFSPVAFATCIDQAIILDLRMGGFHFDDSLTYGKFPLYIPMLMMVVDTLLYSLLTSYFDKVVPGEYGIQYKPFFFLQCLKSSPSQTEVEMEKLITPTQLPADVEPVPQNMEDRLAMKISSITKTFELDKNVIHAVDDFSLDIYEGHITCLLGHNGAGKTTLMNILTGVIPPSSGSAKIMGLDITVPEEMMKIRKSFGICPQHDILYDSLSCKEHLRIFAGIKGVPSCDVETEVLQCLKDVNLENQGDTFAKDLSGGQKRKLSVAIALIGDPKLIFLDEPTAGMDLYSRRHLWSLLKKRKEGRIILLSTHFMDEADILSDRKAFIQKGKLRSCGSSLFLKNRFGIGYHIPMVVEPTCNKEQLASFLKSIIPEIKLQRSHGKEVTFTVPLSHVSKFTELFGKLSESSSQLGIKSYGVSMTTLEEVFLKLEGMEDNDDEGAGDKKNDYHHQDEITTEIIQNKEAGGEQAYGGEEAGLMIGYHGFHGDKQAEQEDVEGPGLKQLALFSKDLITDEKELHKMQFRILLWIRFLSVVRHKKVSLYQIILPAILVLAGLMVIKIGDKETEPAPTVLPLYLNYYVNSSMTPSALPLPSLLLFDSLNTSDSHDIIRGWSQRYAVEPYFTEMTDTSHAGLHFVGMQLDGMAGQLLTNFTVLYNHTALHSIPAAVSMVTQTILNVSGIPAYINATSYPWPVMESKIPLDLNVIIACMLMGLAFTLIIPGFSAEVVRDHEVSLRSQLQISGVSFGAYWGTIYTINICIYLIPSLLIIIAILAFQIPGFNSAGPLGALVLLLLSNIPFFCFFALVLSFLFRKADDCNGYLPFLLNLAALVPYIVISTLDLIEKTDEAAAIHYLLCVFNPPYIVVGGIYYIARLKLFASYSGREIDNSDYFDFDNHILITIIMPFIHMIWMYWLLRVLDVVRSGGKVTEAFPCFSKSVNPTITPNHDFIEDEDSDVTAERLRIDSVQDGGSEKPIAYTRHLRKSFKKRVERTTCSKPGKNKFKVAVRNLSLGVNEGEILGLLGPNGAGKTTALNMIIRETEPTCGNVVIGGKDVGCSTSNVGLCPQHNALWEVITLKEHIMCFAIIKGVPPKEAEKLVNVYVSNLKLKDHISKQAHTLSGGTKRKLCYILSMLGNPDLVLMDEPSTGMDPQSKRFFWDTISSTFRDTKKGAILTTHYMEEADALCSRVGIMVNGQLRCFGSTQHLKDRFGSGYILEVKLAYVQSLKIEESMDKLEDHLRELFPDLQQVERFMERAQYAIPRENVTSLGATFDSLENCKLSHGLEEYNFSQSSLEQVFLHFSKRQVGESEEDIETEDCWSKGVSCCNKVIHNVV